MTSSRKPVILVVDDDLPILTLMRTLLREFGFDAVTASSGSDALTAAREQRPDLVLLDRNMPGMPGDEVVLGLRGQPGLENVPILILSGEPMAREEVARIHADDAVQKPFDVTALVEKIRSHLDQRAVFPER